MLMNNDGEILIDSKEIKHNVEEFEKVKEEIEKINPENLTVFNLQRRVIFSLLFFTNSTFNGLIVKGESFYNTTERSLVEDLCKQLGGVIKKVLYINFFCAFMNNVDFTIY